MPKILHYSRKAVRREAARKYFKARLTLVFAEETNTRAEIDFLEILVAQLKRNWEKSK